MVVTGDFHVHSDISPDSDASMEEMAGAALRRGLKEICFTDHLDVGEHDLGFGDPDMVRYVTELSRAREAVPEIVMRTGVEIGMQEPYLSEAQAFIRQYDPDYVLLSKHQVRGRDPYYPDFFSDMTQREAEEAYLREIYSDMQIFPEFNVIAHIGYVDRYLERSEDLKEYLPAFTFDTFPEILEEILRHLVQTGKGLEINTSRFPGPGTPLPDPSILRRYAELGGEILTFGSDAHAPGALGNGFREAAELAASLGFRYWCTFAEHAPVFHPLS